MRGKSINVAFSVSGLLSSLLLLLCFISYTVRCAFAGRVKLPFSMVQRDMAIQSGKVCLSVLASVSLSVLLKMVTII